MIVPTVRDTLDHAEQYPIFPAGDLAARMAGNRAHYALIESSYQAGYRLATDETCLSIQQNAVTQPVDPVVTPREVAQYAFASSLSEKR